MKNSIYVLWLLFSCLIINAQQVKNLDPSYVKPLDFSEEAQLLWSKRAAFLKKYEDKDPDNLTSHQRQLIEKYQQFETIWDVTPVGCSWYCSFTAGPKSVTASSYLKQQGSVNYKPENAHDLNYKNVWVEGVPGYGIGEFLVYRFEEYSPRITDIIVVNGYVKSQSAFLNNSRVKKLKVYINDKPYAVLNLEDKIANQGFKVGPLGKRSEEGYELSNKFWTLKFEILEVYKGLKYDDVVISEIYFDGLDVHCFGKGTSVLMADGTTTVIENLKIGDWVLAMDFNSKRLKPTQIENLEKVVHSDLVVYQFESGKEITTTKDHPFYLIGKGWASLKPQNSALYKGFENTKMIEPGDYFHTKSGQEKLLSIKATNGFQETYTISKLSGCDNFIANGFVVGVEDLIENDEN